MSTDESAAFRSQINRLKQFCEQLKKAENAVLRSKPGTPERTSAELDRDATKKSLRGAHKAMKGIIENLEANCKGCERFWDDFKKQVMSKWDDLAPTPNCKRLKE